MLCWLLLWVCWVLILGYFDCYLVFCLIWWVFYSLLWMFDLQVGCLGLTNVDFGFDSGFWFCPGVLIFVLLATCLFCGFPLQFVCFVDCCVDFSVWVAWIAVDFVLLKFSFLGFCWLLLGIGGGLRQGFWCSWLRVVCYLCLLCCFVVSGLTKICCLVVDFWV